MAILFVYYYNFSSWLVRMLVYLSVRGMAATCQVSECLPDSVAILSSVGFAACPSL